MQVAKERLTSLIISCTEKVAREAGVGGDLHVDSETELFGGDSQFDSLMLVSLVFELENAIEAEFSVRVALASERAMTEEVSPFSTVDTLAEFARKMLAEA